MLVCPVPCLLHPCELLLLECSSGPEFVYNLQSCYLPKVVYCGQWCMHWACIHDVSRVWCNPGFGSSDSEATTTTITPIVAVGTGNGQIFLFSLSTLQVILLLLLCRHLSTIHCCLAPSSSSTYAAHKRHKPWSMPSITWALLPTMLSLPHISMPGICCCPVIAVMCMHFFGQLPSTADVDP